MSRYNTGKITGTESEVLMFLSCFGLFVQEGRMDYSENTEMLCQS